MNTRTKFRKERISSIRKVEAAPRMTMKQCLASFPTTTSTQESTFSNRRTKSCKTPVTNLRRSIWMNTSMIDQAALITLSQQKSTSYPKEIQLRRSPDQSTRKRSLLKKVMEAVQTGTCITISRNTTIQSELRN